MNPTQAKRLGALLRKRREDKGWSTRQLAELSGVQFSSIIRLELGEFVFPAPDKLARLAKALDLELATVLKMADYDELNQPPSLKVYLRTKHRLSSKQLSAVTRDVEAVLKRHGVEATEQSPNPTTKRTNSKKGGKS